MMLLEKIPVIATGCFLKNQMFTYFLLQQYLRDNWLLDYNKYNFKTLQIYWTGPERFFHSVNIKYLIWFVLEVEIKTEFFAVVFNLILKFFSLYHDICLITWYLSNSGRCAIFCFVSIHYLHWKKKSICF